MTGSQRPCERLAFPLPDPRLSDDDLVLRAWDPADAAELAAAWADPDITRWTGVPQRHDEVAAALWIAGEAARRSRGLALDLVAEVDGLVAGEVGLVPAEPGPGLFEIGWWTSPAFRGQGVAKRAARLLTQWAIRDLGVTKVVARCDRGNPASIAVARAAGFTSAGSNGDFEVWTCC